MRPGQQVQITVNRQGDERTLNVTLGEAEQDPTTAERRTPDSNEDGDDSDAGSMESLGMRLSDVTPAIAQRLGISGDTEGVVVLDVDRNSVAFREARIVPSMIIVEMNRQPVRNLADFRRIYNEIPTGADFLLRLRQSGEDDATMITALTKPE